MTQIVLELENNMKFEQTYNAGLRGKKLCGDKDKKTDAIEVWHIEDSRDKVILDYF